MTYNKASDISNSGREEWTSSPEAAAKHVTESFSKDQRASILCTWTSMSRGSDGDEIEPWGPSIRSVIYPDWSDADFVRAVSLVRGHDI